MKKLIGFGDHRTSDIVARIADEEVAHVAVGVYWFILVCQKMERAPCSTFKGSYPPFFHLNNTSHKGRNVRFFSGRISVLSIVLTLSIHTILLLDPTSFVNYADVARTNESRTTVLENFPVFLRLHLWWYQCRVVKRIQCGTKRAFQLFSSR